MNGFILLPLFSPSPSTSFRFPLHSYTLNPGRDLGECYKLPSGSGRRPTIKIPNFGVRSEEKITHFTV